MTCRELIGFLTDYLEGRLTLRQRFVMRLHLVLCGHCRAYLRNFRATIEAEHAAHPKRDAGENPPVPEGLVRAILAARGSAPQSPRDGRVHRAEQRS